MGYQFIHLEAYARVAGKGKEGGHTIKTIVEEADRVEGNFPHVAEPQKPTIRFGLSAQEAGKLAEEWAENSADSSGRKFRKDGLCLLAGVISYPAELDQWEDFREKSIDWLKKKYGVCLKSVVEHNDESHPHIHFYAVQEPGKRFELLHDGRNASLKAKEEKKLKGAQNLAYKEAMRAFQDQFSNEVAMSCGLTRIGPKKRRLTRTAWHQEKKQAEFFANSKRQHKAARKQGREEGYKEGYKKGVEVAQKEGIEFTRKLGNAVGDFSKSLGARWHEPTEKAKLLAEEQKKLRIEAEELAKKEALGKKQAEDLARSQVKTARAQAQADIDKANRIASNYAKENSSLVKTIQELNEELAQFRRHPTRKAGYKN